MDFKPLTYIYQSSGNPEAQTLLLLHGTGGDERDLLSLVKYFGSNYNILSLRGNITENGMPRFFKRIGMGIFDEADMEFRALEIIAFIKNLAKKEKFNPGKIIALGYSNGANIAGAILTINSGFLEGAILFRPMLPFKSKKPDFKDKSTPVFISTGASDSTVDPADTLRYIDRLEQANFDITRHDLNAGHNLTQEDIDLAAQWLQKSF